MKHSIMKGIAVIFTANVINMILNVCTSILLPKYLSVDTYAQIKTYQLYMTYVGICHLGFVDGIYLKYGGKQITEIDSEDIFLDMSTLKIFQLLILIIGIVIAKMLNSPIFVCVAIMVVPTNMLTFYKYFYQAVGEFKKYGTIINFLTLATFIVNMFFLFVIKIDYYMSYLIGYLFFTILVYFCVELLFLKRYRLPMLKICFSIRRLVREIKSGVLLTFGNFASALFVSLDRWFVKIKIGNSAFAYYSFAVSMESFLNVAITSVSITFYNAFSKEKTLEKITLYRKIVIMSGIGIVGIAFPLKLFVEIFIGKYAESVNLIFLLFASEILYFVIKCIYINLYKVKKEQKRYFIKLCIVLGIGYLANVIASQIIITKEIYAITTMISAFIWLIIVQFDFEKEKMEIKEIIYLCMEICVFLCCGYALNAIVGFIVYMIATVILSYICMRDTLKKIAEYMRVYIKSIK